ncbi:MAG: hypothetical protein DHS20C19_26400 [Acidimicrobiales bacterium]|nr:MAG: hypothetical protein DHS20C19_26400 [Acidimicrobiales bacterium]
MHHVALILADHEEGFELARQRPAAITSAAVLGFVLVLVAARNAAVRDEHPRSAGVRLSYATVAFTVAALVAGNLWVQQSSYILCGPVLYEHGERGACASTMAAHRSWMTALGWLAAWSFALSLIAAARRPQSSASGVPPPGTMR